MTVFENASHVFDVSVERVAKATVRISWKTRFKDLQVSIYHGNSPETMQRNSPLYRIKDETTVEISGLNSDMPHYFAIVPDKGSARVISERRLPLQGAVNFRDLGGYAATAGQRLKWGKVFRSDHLSNLTERDIDFLKRMKIHCVCDFRTSTEARRRPDRFPGDGLGKHLHLPIDNLKSDPTDLFKKLERGDTSWLTKEFLIEGYIINIEEFAPVWGEVFKRLADPGHLPLVFHCTGGKDRAGTCAALFLLSLGVSEKTVIYDHGLSNIYIRDVVNGLYAKFDAVGIDREKISPYFSAPQYCIEALLAHLHEKYGSPIEYLKSKAGVTEEMLERMREALLE
jgi:protein-tyrosine phosphatase